MEGLYIVEKLIFSERISLDFSSISNGIYILNIENELSNYNHKLILN